jgi:hypothetical protein
MNDLGHQKFRAELISGEIVELSKDCACAGHDGPCWINSDEFYRKRNLEILERGVPYLAPMGFAIEEAARLGRKAAEMRSRGIVRLLNDQGEAHAVQNCRETKCE